MTELEVRPGRAASNRTHAYTEQSIVTAPGRLAHLYDELPTDLEGVCRAIQGLIVHYTGGTAIPPNRLREIDTRLVEAMLARFMKMDGRPLAIARRTEARLVGCCRDYAVLLCSVLRHRGIPARLRFGFATYFVPTFLADHVVTEYWSSGQQRWVLVDAQRESQDAPELGFDALDVPRDRFLLAGYAWQRCRRGDLDPNRCGANERMCGLPFVAGYVSHDLAALGGFEPLCWDRWGLTDIPPNAPIDADVLEAIDAAAAAAIQGRASGPDVDRRLRLVGELHAYSSAGVYTTTVQALRERKTASV